jgi:hypothetical protein
MKIYFQVKKTKFLRARKSIIINQKDSEKIVQKKGG